MDLINPTNQSSSNRGINNSAQRSANVRLTWQADAKNKFSVFVDDQGRCQCANVNGTTSPEAANDLLYPIERMATVAWTAPVSNRLLLEARGGFRGEHYEYSPTKTDPNLDLIPVTELGGPVPGILYHGTGLQTNTQPYQNTYGRNFDTLATMSYVTGSHAFKTGVSDTIILRDESLGDDNAHVSYVFNSPDTNPTVPNPVQIQERTTPYLKSQRQPAGIGLFAQDKWTLKQLTLNLGVRYNVETPRAEKFNNQAFVRLNTPGTMPNGTATTTAFCFSSACGSPRTLWPINYYGLEPRIGISYAPTSRSTLRASYVLTHLPLTGYENVPDPDFNVALLLNGSGVLWARWVRSANRRNLPPARPRAQANRPRRWPARRWSDG